MASNIDPTKPTTTTALTADVRSNFQFAKDEIEVLQAAVAAGYNNPTTAVQVSTTSFKIEGTDVTSEYHIGRRLKTIGGGDRYAKITASSFSTDTTITVSGTTDNTGTAATLPAGITTSSVGPLADDTSSQVQFYPTLSGETGVTDNTYDTGNPLRYGGVGNGVVDDTAAIKAASEALNALGGGTLDMRGKTWLIEPTTRFTDTVTGESLPYGIWLYSNMTLLMDARTILKQTTWDGNGVGNDDSAAMIGIYSATNVVVEGGGATILGHWTSGGSFPSRTEQSQHGIHVGNSTNVTVQNLTSKGWWYDGWTVSYIVAGNTAADNSVNVNFINVNCPDNGRNGASMVGCVGGSIIGGEYKDTVRTDPLAGIDLEPNNVTNLGSGGSTNSMVTGVRIEGVKTTGNTRAGIQYLIGAGNNDRVFKNTITGCIIEDGIRMTQSGHNTITGNYISNSNTGAGYESGLLLTDVDHTTITGNVIADCQGHGISLQDDAGAINSRQCVISDNVISNNSLKTDNTYSGITTEARECTISNNRIYKGSTGFQKYGIELTANCINNTLIDNDLYQAGQTADFSNGGATPSATPNIIRHARAGVVVLGNADATPNISEGDVFQTQGTTAITDFDNGVTGKVITVICDTDNIVITDGTNIFLNGSSNYTMTDTDTLQLMQKSDGLWYEVSRSVN